MIVIDHPPAFPEAVASVRISRRQLLAGFGLGSALAATGCASPSLKLLGGPFRGKGGHPGGYSLSPEQIEAIPYASLGVRIGDSAPVIMILASINGRRLHWASADRVVLVTEAGRLVKTIGMPRDLVETRWTGADALLPALRREVGADEVRIGRIVDLRPQDDFGVPVESRCEWRGETRLKLLGSERSAILLTERIRVRKWRWKTENRYWFDPATGQMLKSRQQYCPDVAPVTLEALKPADEQDSAHS